MAIPAQVADIVGAEIPSYNLPPTLFYVIFFFYSLFHSSLIHVTQVFTLTFASALLSGMFFGGCCGWN
jgi:hypothetical protein